MSNQHDTLNAWVQNIMLELARNSFTIQHASDRTTPVTKHTSDRVASDFRMIEHSPHALGRTSQPCGLANRRTDLFHILGIAGACAAVIQACASTSWHASAPDV